MSAQTLVEQLGSVPLPVTVLRTSEMKPFRGHLYSPAERPFVPLSVTLESTSVIRRCVKIPCRFPVTVDPVTITLAVPWSLKTARAVSLFVIVTPSRIFVLPLAATASPLPLIVAGPSMMHAFQDCTARTGTFVTSTCLRCTLVPNASMPKKWLPVTRPGPTTVQRRSQYTPMSTPVIV